MEYIISLVLGIFGSLIAWEIGLHHKKWCVGIIRAAARRLPEEQRIVRLEEWLAALDEHVGLVSSFSHAVGCWIGAPAVGASFGRPAPAVRKVARSTNTVTIKLRIGALRILSAGVAKSLADIGTHKDIAGLARVPFGAISKGQVRVWIETYRELWHLMFSLFR